MTMPFMKTLSSIDKKALVVALLFLVSVKNKDLNLLTVLASISTVIIFALISFKLVKQHAIHKKG